MEDMIEKYQGLPIGELIEDEYTRRGISQRDLAASVGEHPQTLNAIIIGRRKDLSTLDLEKRMEEAHHSKIEIRSFDSLTTHFNKLDCMTDSIEEFYMDCELDLWRNRYSMNPLSRALSFKEWSEVCTKKFPTFHLFEKARKLFDEKEQLNHFYDVLAALSVDVTD